jgi:multidrug efflux pump subunit AcrA (membrane-fusion protein)
MILNGIKEMIQKDIRDLFQKNKFQEAGNLSALQINAKRLLIYFFVILFFLTILSNISDSITIAKVTTINPSSLNLIFQAEGTGTVTADTIQYIKIPEGLSIDQVSIKEGQKVEKGDQLLRFNLSDIKDVIELAETDTEKFNLQIQQEELGGSDFNFSGQIKSEMLYKNSKRDLYNTKNELSAAQAEYQKLKAEYVKAQAHYKQTIKKDKEELYTVAVENYKIAKSSYDNISIMNEESLKAAERKVDNAKKALDKLKDKDNAIMEAIVKYQSSLQIDWEQSQEALESLYILAYGGDRDEYDKHREDSDMLKENVSWAKKVLKYAESDYEDAEDNGVSLTVYEKAVDSAKKELKDAREVYDTSIMKETKIRTAMDLYVNANRNNDKVLIDKAFLDISEGVYGVSGYEEHKTDLIEAEQQLTYAEEDKTLVQKKNDIALTAEQDKLDKLQIIINKMDAGTYDYKQIIASEKQEVEAAEQEADTAKKAVKAADNRVETAGRTVESTEYDLEQAKKQDIKSNTSINMRVKLIQLDLEKKQNYLDELRKLQMKKGIITATVSGTIVSTAAKAGSKSSSDSYIAVSTGSYSLITDFSKEEGEYISIGDEMRLTARGKRDFMKTNVEGIQFTVDDQGKEQTEVTTALPEGDYIPGASLTAEINKVSELYDYCVPIEAVREDMVGTYVLIAKSKLTVLGEELTAERISIEITDKDATMAAVTGNLNKEDNIIINSNKEIKEGNRVRIKQ